MVLVSDRAETVERYENMESAMLCHFNGAASFPGLIYRKKSA